MSWREGQLVAPWEPGSEVRAGSPRSQGTDGVAEKESGRSFGLSASTVLGYPVVTPVSHRDRDILASSIMVTQARWPQASLGAG